MMAYMQTVKSFLVFKRQIAARHFIQAIKFEVERVHEVWLVIECGLAPSESLFVLLPGVEPH